MLLKRWGIPLASLCAMTMVVYGQPAAAQVIKGGPTSCPAVALTYDLCPVRMAPGFDRELVEYLIANHIPATFFMSGRWMARHDAEVKQLLAVPFFEIGTHGDLHAHLPMQEIDEQQREILNPVRFLKTKYGRSTTLFRPPYGEYNDQTVEAVRNLGLRFILWNIESGDPDPTLSADALLARIGKRMTRGSVIVMHANGKGKHTREVTQSLMPLLSAQHLLPMTVSDLLQCNQAPAPPKP